MQHNKQHLKYHIAPNQGLMNDPNGLIYYKGYYHIFYQWNPLAMNHDYKCWGHVKTKDFVHYEELPIALQPNKPYDKHGCYSGSAIVKDENLYLFYTGNTKANNERVSYQCLAVSSDGINFQKHGVIIETPKEYTQHIRDPKVWEYEGSYYMLVGAKRLDSVGCAILYKSDDLYNWNFFHELHANSPLGYMWECPDYVHLRVSSYLLVCPQGIEAQGDHFQNIYQSGYMKLNDIYNTTSIKHNFHELDHGFEFYAPQTFRTVDKRVVLIAWMGVMDKEVENALPTRKENWMHMLSIPRELYEKKGRLCMRPIKELQNLRDTLLDVKNNMIIEENALELYFHVENEEFEFSINKDTSISYKNKICEVKRKNWYTNKEETRKAEISDVDSVHIYLEKTSMEVFINEGELVFSLRYFSNEENKINYKCNKTLKIIGYTLNRR